MTVAKFLFPHKRSLCFLLLLLTTPVLSIDYPSVYIPIGVGQSHADRNLSAPVGEYGSLFNYCGSYTTDELNEQFKLNNAASSHDYMVHCAPSPTRIILSVEGNIDFGKFPRDLKKECELFTCSSKDYEVEKADLGNITNGEPGSKALAPKPENPEYNVCMGKKAGYSEGSTGKVLFANEDNCQAEHKSLATTITNGKKFVQLPRWLEKDEDRFNLRTFIYKTEMIPHMFRVPYGIVPKIDKTNTKFKACNTACDRGQIVKLTMNPGSYSMMIYVKNSCSNFQICISPFLFDSDDTIPDCQNHGTVDVMIDNGFVMFNKKGRASLIELKSQYHQDAHAVAIEFGYGVKNPRNSTEVLSEFYVANDHREFVTSDTDGFKEADAAKLAFLFPDPHCLVENAGIFSKFIQTGKTWTSEKVKVVGSTYNKNGTSITGPQKMEPPQIPTPEVIVNIPKTTTAAPLQIIPGPVAAAVWDSDTQSKALYVSGKWWIWGMYIGFIVGTIFTLLLGAGIFYLFRRTVFGIWYRGMYKRYGCDVSGTTGGITGVGYGNTVTGTQTVQGTTGAVTTAAGTTGGESTGSTGSNEGGATEATSTTSMLDKTNTLAM